jgi:hypothetical protein
MDSATILVLFLCAGVVALLMWFEMNSRRNEASKTAQSVSAETLKKKSQTAVEPRCDKREAA